MNTISIWMPLTVNRENLTSQTAPHAAISWIPLTLASCSTARRAETSSSGSGRSAARKVSMGNSFGSQELGAQGYHRDTWGSTWGITWGSTCGDTYGATGVCAPWLCEKFPKKSDSMTLSTGITSRFLVALSAVTLLSLCYILPSSSSSMVSSIASSHPKIRKDPPTVSMLMRQSPLPCRTCECNHLPRWCGRLSNRYWWIAPHADLHRYTLHLEVLKPSHTWQSEWCMRPYVCIYIYIYK